MFVLNDRTHNYELIHSPLQMPKVVNILHDNNYFAEICYTHILLECISIFVHKYRPLGAKGSYLTLVRVADRIL